MDALPETYLELIYAAIAVVGTLLALLLLRLMFMPLLRSLTDRTSTDLDAMLVRIFALPLYLGVALAGLYVALLQLSALEERMDAISKALVVAATVLGFYALLRLINELMLRYARKAEEREEFHVSQSMDAIRKITDIVLIGLLVTLILGQLGYEITPLLASLGVAGVAVAIALQDTLGNLFAGFYILFDRPLRVGDYIKLESGEEGFVSEIGWRNTKIRPWANNLIIIPNSKLSQSILVNHHLPEPRQNIYIACGVSYDSDLEHVERVCVEVGKQVMDRIEGTDEEWEPVVRYKEFADSNINFLLVLRIKEFGCQYVLSHECIKALHKRFREEGIEISWPVRKLVPAGTFEMGRGPEV